MRVRSGLCPHGTPPLVQGDEVQPRKSEVVSEACERKGREAPYDPTGGSAAWVLQGELGILSPSPPAGPRVTG